MNNIASKAKAYDNRVNRMASVLDTARPFVAVKPIGYLNPVIGHYSTMKAATTSARKFNLKVENDCHNSY